MLNIVIPMAGKGSRFSEAGYTIPKPFIPIHGKPMIERVLENLTPSREHRFILICQSQHLQHFDLRKTLEHIPNVIIIGIDQYTEGQLSTVLLAKQYITLNDPVMTANSDQFIDFKIDDYLENMDAHDLDGMIMTMTSEDPKWSYVKYNDKGQVSETAEKVVISNQATVGIYNFRTGRDFLEASEQLIKDNIRTNNEFYICPIYNYLIKKQKKIGTYNIGEEYNGMYGLGIPSDLTFFLNHPISQGLKK